MNVGSVVIILLLAGVSYLLWRGLKKRRTPPSPFIPESKRNGPRSPHER